MKPESQRFGSANFVTVRVHRQEWGDFARREHMAKLTQLDYVLVHRGLNGRLCIYELDLDFRQLAADVANLVATTPTNHSLKLPKHFKLTTLSYLEPTLRVLVLKGRAGARSRLNRDQTLLGTALLSDLAVISPNDQALDFCAAGS